MKRHQTPGAGLLRAARSVLKAELLPHLPEEKRLEALMVLSALGMAERELEQRPPGDEAERIAAFLEVEDGQEAALRRQLAEAIRAGRFDGDPQLYELSRAGLRWRVRETDPRALEEG